MKDFAQSLKNTCIVYFNRIVSQFSLIIEYIANILEEVSHLFRTCLH